MRTMILAVIATISLLSFALQLSVNVTPGAIMIAYASTNVTGNNQTEDVPNLIITAPPPLLSSADRTDVDRTNATQVRPPTGNYNNTTALVTEDPRQIITGRSAMGEVIPQNQLGQNMPNAVSGNNVINIPNINITKEQALKAEQEANVMIKAYYEKVKQEEEEKARKEAAALAAAQANQTTTESTDEAEESEDFAAASTDETETNGEGENEEQEEGDSEAGDENEDDSQDEGEEG